MWRTKGEKESEISCIYMSSKWRKNAKFHEMRLFLAYSSWHIFNGATHAKKHSLMVVLTVPIASVWIVNRWLYWCCDVLDLAIIVAWNWARFCDRFFLHKFISFSSEIMKHSVCQFEKNIRHVFNISIWFWSCKQWIWSSNSFRWNTMSHRAK